MLGLAKTNAFGFVFPQRSRHPSRSALSGESKSTVRVRPVFVSLTSPLDEAFVTLIGINPFPLTPGF